LLIFFFRRLVPTCGFQLPVDILAGFLFRFHRRIFPSKEWYATTSFFPGNYEDIIADGVSGGLILRLL
jgi:hypothetical protein